MIYYNIILYIIWPGDGRRGEGRGRSIGYAAGRGAVRQTQNGKKSHNEQREPNESMDAA